MRAEQDLERTRAARALRVGVVERDDHLARTQRGVTVGLGAYGRDDDLDPVAGCDRGLFAGEDERCAPRAQSVLAAVERHEPRARHDVQQRVEVGIGER